MKQVKITQRKHSKVEKVHKINQWETKAAILQAVGGELRNKTKLQNWVKGSAKKCKNIISMEENKQYCKL